MPTERVATLSDLPQSEPVGVTVGDVPVVLVRRGETVHALAGLCPHKKVPLGKGIVSGDTLVCGIHRAAFHLSTGEVVEPPACESLARYKVTIEGGDVSVTVPEEHEPHPVPPMASRTAGTPDERHFVIVGAGAAGWTAAETLRREGFGGRITVIDREERLPYDRTDLSKSFLASDDPSAGWRRDEAFLQEHDITLKHGSVESLNSEAKRVVLKGGEHFAYDAVLLAPGSTARQLDVPGAKLAGIHTLRTLEDARALRGDLDGLDGDVPVVVIGGGFIGMEAAASLSGKGGVSVTVVMPDEVPFRAVVGEEMGQHIRAEHEAEGVRFVTGSERGAVSGFRGNGRVEAVETEAGDPIPARLVIVGIGAAPATEWLDLSLDSDGGISVGDNLAVGGAEGVWAAGDIARLPTRWGTARIEHWRHAQQLGALAARNMLGRGDRYSEAPFFWTAQQIEGSYFYTGHAEDWDEARTEGDPSSGQFVTRYIKDGRVMATFGHGKLGEQARIEREMAERGPLDA